MQAMMICGSRNPEGQTARAADAVLGGLEKSGAGVERAFLPTLSVERCRQCGERGWGICRSEGRCVIEDDFEGLARRLRQADAVVLATPVYFSDLSESMKAFMDRLRRVCRHESGRASIEGKPAVGICVAGGGGGGAPACCVSLEKVAKTCGFDMVDLIPVRRQNLQAKLHPLEICGQWLASGAGDAPA